MSDARSCIHQITKEEFEIIFQNSHVLRIPDLVILGPYFQTLAPSYNLLSDLHFATNLLLFPGLFSVKFVIVLSSYHMKIYPAI